MGAQRIWRNGVREPRHPYDVVQKVAPYDGRWFPASEEFVEVQCHDLTRAGFSFLLPRRPAFKSIVASFQGPDETLFFEAEVMQVSRALVQPDGSLEIFRRPDADRGGHSARSPAGASDRVPFCEAVAAGIGQALAAAASLPPNR